MMNRRREATACPRCGQKSDYAKCPHCRFQKWYNPSRNTHNKMCKCKKCHAKKEKKRSEKKPRVRGK
ncbi:hypothetical protein HY637_04625 [Candidatus Woesearchaeota archaeon]|nr:hypothetical protein [Candidatus Woesearchaeota archaeon]